MEQISQGIEQFLAWLDALLWGNWLIVVLLGVGVIYTVATGGIQIRGFHRAFKNLVRGQKEQAQTNGHEMSSFQAFLVSLGSSVGSGNIVGVSTAIIAGGAGALFWMWVAAFVGMATKYAEIVLGVKTHVRDESGDLVGGPMYYIRDRLKSPLLGALCAIFLFIQNASGTLIQSNVFAKVIEANFNIPSAIVGVALAVMMIIIINGGLKRLVSVESKLVPIMASLYILGGIVLILANITNVPYVFSQIFTEAMSFKAVGGAGIGAAIKYGVARGLYSNEAGEGSAAVIHGRSDTKDPYEEGLYGIVEVFVDTIILCTNTGLCILISGVPLAGANANTIAAQAFATLFEPLEYIVYICLILFVFTSLLSQWLFGHTSMQYFKSYRGDFFYKIFFPIAIVVGSLSTVDMVWNLQDCALGLLIIPNIICLIYCAPQLARETRTYLAQSKDSEHTTSA